MILNHIKENFLQNHKLFKENSPSHSFITYDIPPNIQALSYTHIALHHIQISNATQPVCTYLYNSNSFHVSQLTKTTQEYPFSSLVYNKQLLTLYPQRS